MLRDITTRVSGTLAPLRDEVQAAQQHPPVPPVAVPERPAGEVDSPDRDNGGVPTASLTEPRDLDPSATPDPDPSATPDPDPVCAAALELARTVAVEVGGAAVGEHQGIETDGPLVVTHSFATTDPAYVGWRWAVTVARSQGSDTVTVDEVVLLPGSGALVAPAWVPYSERVQPQDLAPGDLLPPAPQDGRLVPSYADPEAELAAEVFWELGLGRPRVLSQDGRDEAAERWYDGDRGPFAPMARQAPGQCLDCAFRVGLLGSLRALFGVCANAQSPDDGRVVSLDHGCGAHSETAVELTHTSTGPLVVLGDDDLEITATADASDPEAETPDGHAS